jgi:hypothetical protein
MKPAKIPILTKPFFIAASPPFSQCLNNLPFDLLDVKSLTNIHFLSRKNLVLMQICFVFSILSPGYASLWKLKNLLIFIPQLIYHLFGHRSGGFCARENEHWGLVITIV